MKGHRPRMSLSKGQCTWRVPGYGSRSTSGGGSTERHAFAELFSIRTSSAWKDLALGISLGGLWVVADGMMGTPPFAEMSRLDAAKLISVPTSLSAGLCEEFLFRGFVFLVIARAGGSGGAQIIWSSLAFGAAHFAWGPYGMLFTFLLGLTLGAARHLRGGVWSAVAAHSILNLCIEPGLMEWAMQTRAF